MELIRYIGVVFPFMGSLPLDRHHFYFMMILEETLKFLSLSNPVLQYEVSDYFGSCLPTALVWIYLPV